MFKLNIECSRDFDELHINFSDGSSSVITNNGGGTTKTSTKKNTSKPTKPKTESKPKPKPKEEFLDLDAEFGDVSQDVVSLPDISQNSDRPVKVADELQNLDI